ncbi:hypothetical protein PORY_001267 [Pneumocystis oryctolagi]|uniref:Uncharacterized protein n=1 Tax=Pneumocystis oryctolagi TaxID=42067 RepID=A0ACB7CF24_9ASCO|nr:hypothetical protein PORY_001267 [Pneumocystis oryctolagi]
MKESTGSFSISFKSAKDTQKSKKSESTYVKKTVLKNDSDNEEEEEVKDELLSGFDQSGALSLNPEKQTKKHSLVIPPLKNKDFRQEIQKYQERLSCFYKKDSIKTENSSSYEKTEEKTQTYGLTFINSKKEISSEKTEIPSEKTEIQPHSPKPSTETEANEDERAIKALLNDLEGKKSDSNLVLPMITSNTDWKTNARRLTEDEIYRIDILSLPDPSTLEDYENVPVEEFGNALLRGMGWKEGESIGKDKNKDIKPIKVVRRAQFLGIGAKEYDAQELDELGAWGKGITKQRIDKTYVPVLKINKTTGKVVSETLPKSKSEETYEKNISSKKSPERFRNGTKKYNHDYFPKERRTDDWYRNSDENHSHSNYSTTEKNSNGYRYHYSTDRHKNRYYERHRDKH